MFLCINPTVLFNWILPQGIVLLDDIIWNSFTLLLVISLATCKVLLNIAIFFRYMCSVRCLYQQIIKRALKGFEFLEILLKRHYNFGLLHPINLIFEPKCSSWNKLSIVFLRLTLKKNCEVIG